MQVSMHIDNLACSIMDNEYIRDRYGNGMYLGVRKYINTLYKLMKVNSKFSRGINGYSFKGRC